MSAEAAATRSTFTRPGWTLVSSAVAVVTFKEVLRQKLLYNILVVGLLLFGVAFLASNMTYIGPDRVVLDFGVTAMNLSGAAIAIILGSALINREFERRTIFVALSHPISRFQFLFGKYLGLAAILALNWFLFSIILTAIVYYEGGRDYFNHTYLCALFYLLLQTLVLEAIAVLFSTFTTTTLAVVFSIGMYLVGTNVSQMRSLATRLHDPFGSSVLNGISAVLPNLENFNLGFKVTYGLPVSGQNFAYSVGYAVMLIAVSLLLAGFSIERREG